MNKISIHHYRKSTCQNIVEKKKRSAAATENQYCLPSILPPTSPFLKEYRLPFREPPLHRQHPITDGAGDTDPMTQLQWEF